jgi:hypothetical protein
MPEFDDQQSGRCSDSPFSTSGTPLQDSPRRPSMIDIPVHVRTTATSPRAARLMSQSARSNMYRATTGPQRSSSTCPRRVNAIRNAHHINATHGATPRQSPPKNTTTTRPHPTSHPETPARSGILHASRGRRRAINLILPGWWAWEPRGGKGDRRPPLGGRRKRTFPKGSVNAHANTEPAGLWPVIPWGTGNCRKCAAPLTHGLDEIHRGQRLSGQPPHESDCYTKLDHLLSRVRRIYTRDLRNRNGLLPMTQGRCHKDAPRHSG